MVSGPPRSGTSLTTGFVSYCGAWVGDCVGAAPGNPHGFFENRDLRETLTKSMLSERGIDPLGQHPLVGHGRPVPTVGRRGEIERLIRAQGYSAGPWVMKSAKVLLMLDDWLEMFPDAIWLVTRRPVEAVAESCRRAGFMSTPGPGGWGVYVRAYMERIERLVERAYVFRIDTPDLAAGDTDGSGIVPALRACGLKVTDRARDFIDPEVFTQ